MIRYNSTDLAFLGIKCYRCKHFIGQDVEGYIHCDRLGKTVPMIKCRHFVGVSRNEG